MTFPFSKYHGAGNDFILIDNRRDVLVQKEAVARRLCDRHFGIGSDGLILIENHPNLDYRMVFFNPDGSQSLCGNGSRCAFRFAQSLGLAGDNAIFETTDGIHRIANANEQVRFELFDVAGIENIQDFHFVNTGSPHIVKIVEDIEKVDVVEEGRKIRYADRFVGQNGTNVNFAQLLQDRVLVRTYERGVENETLACGTGVTAVGLVMSEYNFDSPVTIEAKGGTLKVAYDKSENGFKNIWLTGPAEHVFDGQIEI